jgi:hypothetical protein
VSLAGAAGTRQRRPWDARAISRSAYASRAVLHRLVPRAWDCQARAAPTKTTSIPKKRLSTSISHLASQAFHSPFLAAHDAGTEALLAQGMGHGVGVLMAPVRPHDPGCPARKDFHEVAMILAGRNDRRRLKGWGTGGSRCEPSLVVPGSDKGSPRNYGASYAPGR